MHCATRLVSRVISFQKYQSHAPKRTVLALTPASQLYLFRLLSTCSKLSMATPVKRKASNPISPPKIKKKKVEIPEYHLAISRRGDDGEIVWPARKEQIERAREIIKEWFG
ncbi:hypothetical protein P280DRAFT_469413 [Massarina eburnea CBS 473.64]|uniref:Uncharacterized protein n=1 Tax=Massarina eburnea CBS 473.64 TaxID=1395130 RepID=A0A6A6RZE4_9PLEO|nr:hypothetical protein P280DRAFT_469413 [Massarina eburnea CBS 473.64]